MMRHRKGLSRFLHDIVEDTKNLLDEVTDSIGDVEHDTRSAVSRALRPDERDHDRRSGRSRRERDDDYGDHGPRDRSEGLETQLTGLREELHRLVELLGKNDEEAGTSAKAGSASK
ncbi:hypothetical protein ACFYO9_11590 [Streptomyces sp. NPDC005863]|uniref:hypothetical protein n=1 Tax=unclassified Streptomyces TaxID=2593676 RepID=UPI0033EA0F91